MKFTENGGRRQEGALTIIDRRAFLRAGLAAGALLAGRRALGQDNPWKAALDEYGRVRPPTFPPMPRIPVLAPVRSDAQGDVFELTARPGSAQPLPGAPTAIWGFDGRWPAPTIRATRGRVARVRVKNELDENLSVHNHGHHVGPESDGHPLDYIAKGTVKEYVYPNAQAGGTYWYHDHTFGLTGPHVYQGLAGLYLIDDPGQDELRLPSGEHDVAIAIQDRIFDTQNALSYSLNAGTLTTGFLGNTLCVNGVHVPRFEVAARKYRFRFLNGSNARNYRLALADGGKLIQIASDGYMLAAPIARASVDLAPSERCDCVIDFSAYSVGTSIMLKNSDPTWPNLPDVMRFDVVRKEADASEVPARLTTVDRLDGVKARQTRGIKFGLSDGKWTMNGLLYDPGRIDFRPRLDSVEIWELHNAEPTQMHPFHQHLVPFQVLSIDGAAPPPELRGWKDTVAVGPGSRVRIAMKFTHFKGVYVFHCHKLEHEDHAMMLQQEVG